MPECTQKERDFLNHLLRNMSNYTSVPSGIEPLDVFVKDHQPNTPFGSTEVGVFPGTFTVTFSGGGGPEPEWVYKQPRIGATLLAEMLEEACENKAEEARRKRNE